MFDSSTQCSLLALLPRFSTFLEQIMGIESEVQKCTFLS
jgi:hypothetical protein